MDSGSTVGLGLIVGGAAMVGSIFVPDSTASSFPGIGGLSSGTRLGFGLFTIGLGMASSLVNLDGLLGGGGGKGKPSVKRPSSPEPQAKPSLEKR